MILTGSAVSVFNQLSPTEDWRWPSRVVCSLLRIRKRNAVRFSAILKSEGLHVFQAENADKALGYIDENIDVVLSDLNLGRRQRNRSAESVEKAQAG